MTNLIENLNNVAENDIIFIESEDGTGRVFVALDSWFETMPLSSLYDDYGQEIEKQHCDECVENEEGKRENCECEEYEVRAYSFWNGSNWESFVLESSDGLPTDGSVIVNENEIETYMKALKNAKFKRGDFVKEYKAKTETGEKLYIFDSAYQGRWELYTITDEYNRNQA